MVSVTEPCGDWACPSHPFAEVHRSVWEPAVFTQEHAEIERLLGQRASGAAARFRPANALPADGALRLPEHGPSKQATLYLRNLCIG
jgi:hypothetical protein